MVKMRTNRILGYQRLSNLLFSIDHAEINEFIDIKSENFMKWHGTEKYKQSDMKNLLKEIVKILEVPGSKDDFTAGFVD